MKKLKCYIYGAGNEYNRLCSYMMLYRDKIEILGIVTTSRQKFSMLDGFECIVPDEMNQENMDYVIIAVREWKEIADILRSMGIPEEKFLRSSIFYNPYFDLEEYLKLKESKVSILSNFCLGGHIYRELGLKVLSPTINMFCLGTDYLEFLRHYDYYLNAVMKVYEVPDCYIPGTLNRENFIPKGIIDSKIIWHFNHGDDADTAVSKWNEARKKVNFENIAALMTIQSDEEAYAFEQLPISKKLGIYYKNLHLKSVLFCPEWSNWNLRHQYDFNWPSYANRYMTNMIMASKVDWIKFLNGKEDFIRYF